MARTYEITSEPALIDLGRGARVNVWASVPFAIEGTRYCGGYVHAIVRNARGGMPAVRALGSATEGRITVLG